MKSSSFKYLFLLFAVSCCSCDVQAFQSSSASHRRKGLHPGQRPSSVAQSLPLGTKYAPSRSSSTQLQVSPLTAIASSPVGALGVLAGIVVVHEAGHYLAARAFNISVQEFSVGFGPRLAGFEALGNEFNLRAFPLGGFVRFPENYDANAVEELQNKAREAFAKRRQEEDWKWWMDVANVLTLGEWDERRRRKQQASIQEETAKLPWWKKPFSRKTKPQVSIDPEDFQIDYFDDPNLLQNRPWVERAVVLSGGVIFNIILAFLLYFGEINQGQGIPQPVFESGVVVAQTPRPDGPSAKILRQGDIIVGINGIPVSFKGSGMANAQQQVTDVISEIRKTNVGDSLTLSVKHSNRETPEDISLTPQMFGSVQSIGVFLGPNFARLDRLKSSDLGEAARLAYQYLVDIMSQTAAGVLSLLGQLIMGKGPPPGQSVSGPIGLIKSGTEVVSSRDVTAVVLFAAALSVNLGVINALPLPALDGGQLLFVISEALTGRKVPQRLQESITSVAVLLLLFVSISTAFSDVGNIIAGRL